MELKRVMLATAVKDLATLKYPLLASVKIDGIRATNVKGRLLSRSMKEIPNDYTACCFGGPRFHGLDGELVVGNAYDKNLMQQTTSGVMSVGDEPDVKWYIFDKWDEPGPFHARAQVARLAATVNAQAGTPMVWVPQRRIDNLNELKAFEEESVGLGYEGIMLRDPNGPYKQNRSTLKEGYLLKVKRFEDGEAIVLDTIEQETNTNEATTDERGFTKRSSHQAGKTQAGTLGALSVRDLVSGVEFSIGTGFSAEQRANLWEGRKYLVGKIVKYKHFPVGVKNAPRFPVFLGFRDRRDM
jgi:DNA ligase-1